MTAAIVDTSKSWPFAQNVFHVKSLRKIGRRDIKRFSGDTGMTGRKNNRSCVT